MPKLKKHSASSAIVWRGFWVLVAASLLTVIWISVFFVTLWLPLLISQIAVDSTRAIQRAEFSPVSGVYTSRQPASGGQIEEAAYFTIPEGQESFDPLTFKASPDGRSFAYVLKVGNRLGVVLNGRAEPLYEAVTFTSFSPDGQRFAYGVKIGGQEKVVIDGVPGPAYDYTFYISPARSFTPDSRYFIYKARSSQGDQMVVNNTWTSQAYERIYDPVLSADGSQLVYYGLIGDKIWRTVIDLDKTLE